MTHTCHAPSCDKPVPPKLLACPNHWYALPPYLRRLIWAHYQPGQEITKTPSDEYLAVMHDCIDEWDRQNANHL